MKNSSPTIIGILWKIVVALIACTGVYLQAKLDGGLFRKYVFLYFTIMSNMGTAIVLFVTAILQIGEKIKNKIYIKNGLMAIKYMFTAAMTLTLVVSLCLLAPFKSHEYLFSLRNLSLHIYAPFGAVIDFLFFDKRFRCRLRTSFLGFVIPVIYLSVTLLLSIKGITYSNGTLSPYYFLDYRSLGWTELSAGKIGVLWWILLIAVIAYISSFLLTVLKIVIDKLRKCFSKQ